MKCLEWSTGSSTLWVLMRVRHLISIEHHAHWSRMVAQQLAKIYNPDVGFFPFHQRTPCMMTKEASHHGDLKHNASVSNEAPMN